MRIGVLGGSFDPVHLGHLAMGEEARLQLGLDRVLFVPAGQPWMRGGEELSHGWRRAEMVKLAVASNRHFQVCLDEINRPGPTYTVDTLEALVEQLGPEAALFFIIGQDAMAAFHRWKEPDRILALCNLAVVTRSGYESFDIAELAARFPAVKEKARVISMPLMGVSGTEVRRRAAVGVSLRYHVPDAVAEYIERHGLYRQSSKNQADATPARPGGRTDVIGKLLEVAIARGALKYGDFTLTSGKSSKYYFDGRLLSLDPEGSRCIAEALLPVLQDVGVEAVGGPTLGADPIVAAIAVVSGQWGQGIPGFIVRKEAKAHGTGQSIEGPLRSGSRVAVVDDTCTSGGSLFQAIEAAEAAGCTVVKVAAVLDRKEGGSDELRRRGYDFAALLEAKEGTIQAAGDS